MYYPHVTDKEMYDFKITLKVTTSGAIQLILGLGLECCIS